MQSDSNLNILILKSNPPKDFIDYIFKSGFCPLVFKLTKDALETERKGSFPVIIAALGKNADYSDHYLPLLEEIRNKSKKTFFIIFSKTASENALTRQFCIDKGANMVTNCKNSVFKVLNTIKEQITPQGSLNCPICTLEKLTEDSLWRHLPLYHNQEETSTLLECPFCLKKPNNVINHIKSFHKPKEKSGSKWVLSKNIPLYSFALVVVHRKKDNKFLLVHEKFQRGFWLPGGGVDSGEDIILAAQRETSEETGVDVKISGILTIQYGCYDYARLRFIFYGEPVDEDQHPKSIPDFESVGGIYVDYSELKALRMRGDEPEEWFDYVLKGKTIFPLSLYQFSKE